MIRRCGDDCGERHCAVCGRQHLEPTVLQTCVGCLGKARRDLVCIVELAAELEDQAVNGRGNPLDSIGRSAPGSRIPGGEAMVLLAGGSDGLSAVRDIAAGGRGVWADDERASDPVPPVWALARVEDDWRRALGLAAATSTSLSSAAAFVGRHLGWAAQHHEGFPDHAAELAAVRSRLEQVTGAGDRPATGVPCFDCGATLQRPYRQGAACRHRPISGARSDSPGLTFRSGSRWASVVIPPPRAVQDDGQPGPRWEPCGCDQGGAADGWDCPRCGRRYSEPEYFLAVRAALSDQEAS